MGVHRSAWERSSRVDHRATHCASGPPHHKAHLIGVLGRERHPDLVPVRILVGEEPAVVNMVMPANWPRSSLDVVRAGRWGRHEEDVDDAVPDAYAVFAALTA